MNKKLVLGVIVAASAFVAIGVAGAASADKTDWKAPEANNTVGTGDPLPDMAVITLGQ